jgi:hypothetical protein
MSIARKLINTGRPSKSEHRYKQLVSKRIDRRPAHVKSSCPVCHRHLLLGRRFLCSVPNVLLGPWDWPPKAWSSTSPNKISMPSSESFFRCMFGWCPGVVSVYRLWNLKMHPCLGWYSKPWLSSTLVVYYPWSGSHLFFSLGSTS